RAVHLAVFHLLVGGLVFIGGGAVFSGILLGVVFLFLVAAGLVLVLGRLGFVRLGLVVAVVLGHVHGGEHAAHDAGEGLLVVDGGGKSRDVRAGLVLDEVAPQVEHLAGRSRRSPPRQFLAHHERDGFLDGRIGLAADRAEIRLRVFFRQHGG